MTPSSSLILGIGSSCDDTSAVVLRDELLCSNVIVSQGVHSKYGGVMPELASRVHLQNIVPVVQQAVARTGVTPADLDAIAYTRGPGLLGSLIVGTNSAKGLNLTLHIPLVGANHLQAHVLVHFIAKPEESYTPPPLPHLCLLVSGGNSQIVQVSAPGDMRILGQTIDDAAGEAFDEYAKVVGLGYFRGPIVNKPANEGDTERLRFSKPRAPGLDYSFSGLKTSSLYMLWDELTRDADFVAKNKADPCASLQKMAIDILMSKPLRASKEIGIKHIAVAGGVPANTGLRDAYYAYAERYGWQVYIPPFAFTTDDAAMVAMVGTFAYEQGAHGSIDTVPFAKTMI